MDRLSYHDFLTRVFFEMLAQSTDLRAFYVSTLPLARPTRAIKVEKLTSDTSPPFPTFGVSFVPMQRCGEKVCFAFHQLLDLVSRKVRWVDFTIDPPFICFLPRLIVYGAKQIRKDDPGFACLIGMGLDAGFRSQSLGVVRCGVVERLRGDNGTVAILVYFVQGL